MRILGRFDGIHRRLDALEQEFAGQQAAASDRCADAVRTGLHDLLRDLRAALERDLARHHADGADQRERAAATAERAGHAIDSLHHDLRDLSRDAQTRLTLTFEAVAASTRALAAGQDMAASGRAELRALLVELAGELERVDNAVRALAAGQHAAAEARTTLSGTVEHIGRTAQHLAASQDAATLSLNTLDGKLDRLAHTVHAATSGLDALHGDFARIDHTAQVLAAAQDVAGHTLNAIHGGVERLAHSAQALAAGQQDTAQALGAGMDRLAHALTAGHEQAAHALAHLQADLAGRLEGGFGQVMAQVGALHDLGKSSSTFSDTLNGGLNDLAGRVERNGDTVRQEVGNRLDGLSGRLDELARGQTALADAIARQPAASSAPRRLGLPAGDGAQPAPPATLPPIYFVVGCGRSGTTSLARILNRAANGVCHNEPAPVLGREARLLHEGRLAQPFAALREVIGRRVTDALDQGLAYGEKNLTLPPFIPYLHALFRCRFVHVVRDGREVVRSWQDWNNLVYGNIYRECADTARLTPRAVEWLSRSPAAEDEYDVGRPRPLPGDTWAEQWMEFSRSEMLAWHWAFTNDQILDSLARLPGECWRRADYSNIHGRNVVDIARFLGLTGLEEAEVDALVRSRINKLEEMADGPRFPGWKDWSDQQKVAFDAIAAATMRRLGYYPADHVRHRPADFAAAWRADAPPTAADLDWLAARLAPQSLLEACGEDTRARFADAQAATADAAGWLDTPLPPAQLAVARGEALRRCHDVEAGIARLAHAAGDWLFLSFADSGAPGHRHRRDEATGRFDNAVSAAAVAAQLDALDCTVVESRRVDGLTVMLARVGGAA